MLTVRVPLPPSVNNLFANVPGKGRVKSSRYRTWLNAAGWDVRAQTVGMEPIGRPVQVAVEIIAHKPSRRRDLDNIIKPILDLLVACGVLADDDLVQTVSASWGGEAEGVAVVTVRSNWKAAA